MIVQKQSLNKQFGILYSTYILYLAYHVCCSEYDSLYASIYIRNKLCVQPML